MFRFYLLLLEIFIWRFDLFFNFSLRIGLGCDKKNQIIDIIDLNRWWILTCAETSPLLSSSHGSSSPLILLLFLSPNFFSLSSIFCKLFCCPTTDLASKPNFSPLPSSHLYSLLLSLCAYTVAFVIRIHCYCLQWLQSLLLPRTSTIVVTAN